MFLGQVSYILSSIGWIYVGMAWSDRAIMIGSSISGTAVMMNLVQSAYYEESILTMTVKNVRLRDMLDDNSQTT